MYHVKDGKEKKSREKKIAKSWTQRLHATSLLAGLPVQPLENVAVLDIPLPATTGQCRSAVNEAIALYAKHTQLDHGGHKRRIPRALADSKGSKGNRGSRVVCNVLVRLQGKRGTATPGLRVELVVPSTDGRVKGSTSFGGVAVELLGCRVCANKGSEIDGAEAFGRCEVMLLVKGCI